MEHLLGRLQELQKWNIFGHRKMGEKGITGKEKKKNESAAEGKGIKVRINR